jgi:hypothetical protein
MAKNPTKKELIEKYGKENVKNWDSDVIIDKLYEEGDLKKTKRYLINFDPSSNRPFMIWENINGNWSDYSGEESFQHALEVARKL